MKKVLVAGLASLMVSGGLLGAAESKMAAESKASDFGSFMAKNYPELDAYIKSINRTYIYDEATNWPNERGVTLNAIYLHTVMMPMFRQKESETHSEYALRQFEVLKQFEDLWNRFGKNSDLTEGAKQGIPTTLQSFFNNNLYGIRILQYHNEMFFNIWKNANTIEARSNALIYLANTIAAACRASDTQVSCYNALPELIFFVKDNEKKFTKFAREIVQEQIKKIVNEDEHLKSAASLNPSRRLVQQFGW